MATQYAFGKIVTSGLVLALDAADKNSYPGSGTTWRDMSGNGNNGTLTNGPTFNSANGGAIVFDGTNDYCISNNVYSYLSSSAVEVIFSMISFPTASLVSIAGFNAGVSANWGASVAGLMYTDSNKKVIGSVITSTQTYRTVTSTTVLSTGSYYHAVLNKDTVNGSLQLYINGISESTTTFDTASYGQWSTLGFVGSNNIIMSDYNSSNTGWYKYSNMRVSLIRVYGKTLSQAEIQQNYNAQKSRFNL